MTLSSLELRTTKFKRHAKMSYSSLGIKENVPTNTRKSNES